jgi:hypothetical protein
MKRDDPDIRSLFVSRRVAVKERPERKEIKEGDGASL